MSNVTKLPDGSAFFTADVMSKAEAMALPPDKRPLCYRVSSDIYHSTFEAIGAASMCWNPKPSTEVFESEKASQIAVDLLFKFASEIEGVKEQRPTMDEIACRETNPELWTDKRSAKEGFICHDYFRIYEREWGKWRDQPIRLMEIGLNRGASIKVWLEYFQRAQVVGVDIAQFKNEVGIMSERFTFAQGDQSNTAFWEDFKKAQHPFDIIVDDGCHFSGPIHTAFRCLWSHVNPGGYYVVEDLTEVRNPESRTQGFPNQIEFAQNLIEPVIFGSNDIDEAMVSKDLCVLRKKK